MIHSMTGFASAKGASPTHSWSWELRSVNAKGLDLRLRLPDWIPGLEAHLRGVLGKALNRGSVTLSLRVTRLEDGGALALNDAALGTVLSALATVRSRAEALGLEVSAPSTADILSQRGVLDSSAGDDDGAVLLPVLQAEFPELLSAFQQMRAAEGAALAAVLAGQLDEIEALTGEAATLAKSRQAEMAATLRGILARVLENAEGADPDRVAQELAIMAVKSDITEEIDRLGAHVTAARDLLSKGSPVGRKLDFLTQEFNREANTLCAKAQSTDLTNVGLALKAVIDQMREQVQNVE